MRPLRPLLLAGLLAYLLSAPVAGSPQTVRTVCPSGCAYASIQGAINASAAGDTVRVLASSYLENLTLRAGVSLLGSGAGLSIIDGRAAGSAILGPSSDIGPSSLISGFTIRNGRAAAGAGIQLAGGALVANNVPAVIANNLFLDNEAPLAGAGVYLQNGSPNSQTIPWITTTG